MASIALADSGNRMQKFRSWLNVSTGIVTPTKSQLRAGALAHSVTIAVPGLVGFLTGGLPLPLNLALAFASWGIAALAVLKRCPTHETPVQHRGVRTVNGMPVNVIYVPGFHRLFIGEGIIDVSDAPITFNPPAFTELAKDLVELSVDVYFIGHIANPFLWRTGGGEKTMEALILAFVSKIRLFISNWSEAVHLVSVRDLLAEFFWLQPGDQAAIEKFRNEKLMPFTEGKDSMLTKTVVDKIMEDAGKFRADAAKWGYVITTINTEDVAIPPAITEVADEKAALKTKLEIIEERQEFRLGLITKMKQENPKLTQQEVLMAVDLLFEEFPVQKRVNEISMPDLLAIFNDSKMAQAIAGALDRILRGDSQ